MPGGQVIKYGLGIYEIDGYLGHIGQVAGFDSGAFYNVSEKRLVVINMNNYPGDIDSFTVFNDILAIFDGTWTPSAPRAKHYDTPDVGGMRHLFR